MQVAGASPSRLSSRPQTETSGFAISRKRMSTLQDRSPAGAGLNDDIGEKKRLELYRSQVRLREAEQRAFDLFLQNLVKGTSHLSLGQEAIAAGFAEAMVK